MITTSSKICFDRLAIEKSVYPPSLHMQPHTDKYSRISIILDGELQEYTDSEEILAKPGSIVIKPNNVVHENVFGNKPVTSLSINFYDDLLHTNGFTKWQWIDHPRANLLAIRLWTGMKQAKTDKAVIECTDEFFSAIALLKYNAAEQALFWQEQLKELLQKNHSLQENIHDLSRHLSLHRVYMARAFKKKYGVSPVEFRKYTRIAAAILDISLTEKPLAAIAYDTGFSDQSHMNREFRLHTGCTPAAFRQMISGN
jgi:AraC-like DNA-binding protein